MPAWENHVRQVQHNVIGQFKVQEKFYTLFTLFNMFVSQILKMFNFLQKSCDNINTIGFV